MKRTALTIAVGFVAGVLCFGLVYKLAPHKPALVTTGPKVGRPLFASADTVAIKVQGRTPRATRSRWPGCS